MYHKLMMWWCARQVHQHREIAEIYLARYQEHRYKRSLHLKNCDKCGRYPRTWLCKAQLH